MLIRSFNARLSAHNFGDEAQFWQETPATIERFCLSDQYLALDGVIAPSILEVVKALFEPGPEGVFDCSRYREAAFVCGIGWGKTFGSSVVLAYMVHRLLCLRNPQRYYGLADGSNIVLPVFAENHYQSKEIIFGAVQARIDSSPWFQRPENQPDPKIRSVLRFRNHVEVMPLGGKPGKARGWNVLGAIIDEASWLPVVNRSDRQEGLVDEGRFDAAEEIYNALADRVKSRGNERFDRDSLIIGISSPRVTGDFLERKLAEAQAHDDIFGLRAPTWDGFQREHLCGETFTDPVIGEVPVEFKDRFERNALRARRDLGAVPQDSLTRYFPSGLAAKCVDERGGKTPYALEEQRVLAGSWSEDGTKWQWAYETKARWRDDFRGKPGTPYLIHIDLAERHDRAGVCMGHIEGGKLVIDLLLGISASWFSEARIEFARLRELVLELRDVLGFNIRWVSFDGWQSVDSRQILQRRGIPTELISVDRDMAAYATLLDLMTTDRISYYHHPVLISEIENLDLIEGKKVDHGPLHGKDIADAVAGVALKAAEYMADDPRTGVSSTGKQDDPGTPLHEYLDGRKVLPQDAAKTKRKARTGIQVEKVELDDPEHERKARPVRKRRAVARGLWGRTEED